MAINLNITTLESDLFEIDNLKDFIPLSIESTSMDYVDKLFTSSLCTNEFYNNMFLNMSHFYVFILQSFMVRVHKTHPEASLLPFLHKAEFVGRSITDKIIDKENVRHFDFNLIERDTLKHLYHFLNIDRGCVVAQNHKEIFDKRNDIAHYNEISINTELFTYFIGLIHSNLSDIHAKIYLDTKSYMYDYIKPLIDDELIDDENYKDYIQEMNFEMYFSTYDYKKLVENGYLANIQENTPKYYLDKYIRAELGLGDVNDDMIEALKELIADYFYNEVVDHIEPSCYGCQLEEVYIDNVEREENFFIATGTISATARLGSSSPDDSIDVDYSSGFEAKFSYEYDGEYSFELEKLELEKDEWIDYEPDEEA